MRYLFLYHFHGKLVFVLRILDFDTNIIYNFYEIEFITCVHILYLLVAKLLAYLWNGSIATCNTLKHLFILFSY